MPPPPASSVQGRGVDGVDAGFGVAPPREFYPSVDVGALFVAASGAPREVGRGGFGGQEEAGYRSVGGEEMSQGGGAHEGGDAGEVDYARFVGGRVSGGCHEGFGQGEFGGLAGCGGGGGFGFGCGDGFVNGG